MRYNIMAIDHSFIIRKIQTLPEMFVIFSQVTKQPFVTCDEETFDDQIHIFTDAQKAHAFVQESSEQKKIPVVSVKVNSEQFLHFYGTLYTIGINTIVLHDLESETALPLESIVHRRHNPDEIPPEKRPITNPELLLTALYFLQEMRRPIPDEEKTNLQELDEELVANLVRGRFLSGIIVDENEQEESAEESSDNNTEKMKKNNIRVPYINNRNGEMYQAIFTDGYELQKFDPKKRLRPVVIKFDDLEKFLVKDAKGYVLNPVSVALPLRREQLPAFKKRIDG